MSTTRRGRPLIVTRWEISTFISVALVSLYILPKPLKVILAIILLTDTFVLRTPILHLLWVKIIQPTTSLLWEVLQAVFGLLFIFFTHVSDWFTRNRQAGNVVMKTAGKVVDVASYKTSYFSDFFARHPVSSLLFYQWSPSQRTPIFAWMLAVYALYFVWANGFTQWGLIVGVAIIAFAFSGISLILTFASSIASLYYGMKATYQGYSSRLSDWGESVPVPDGFQTREKMNKPFWSRIFGSENQKVSRIVDRVVDYDREGNSRVTEPISRPSLIEVFLPLNPFAPADTTTLASGYRDAASAIKTRMASRKDTIIYTVQGERTKETGSVPTQGGIQPGWRWKFWNSEAPPNPESLPFEEGKKNKVNHKIYDDIESIESIAHQGQKAFKSFANAALTAASTKESKIVEVFLSVTDMARSKTGEAAAKLSIAREAKAKSIAEEKANSISGKEVQKIPSAEEKVRAKASKAAKKLSISEDIVRSQSIKAAEKTSSAQTKASKEELERIASATEKAKARKSKVTGKNSPTVEEDTEVEDRRDIPDDSVIEDISTSIKQRPKVISKVLSAENAVKSKIEKIVEPETSSDQRAAHSAADKTVDRASKVTKVVWARVTDHRYPADGYDYNANDIATFADSYADQFTNTLSSMVANGAFGVLGFFSSLVPKTIGRIETPLDGYPTEAFSEATGYCAHCPRTVVAYSFLIGFGILTAPYLRSLIFRTKLKSPTLLAASIAILFWTPSIMTLVVGLAYRNHFEVGEILQTFRGNLYFLAFSLLAFAKISRTIINAFSYHFLSHPEPAHKIQITPWHVTVILPYIFTTNEPGKTFENCVESILRNNVYNVVLLVHDVETRAAAEQFAMRYSTHFTITIFMSIASDKRTRFIECCRRARSPITIFVEKGTVIWSPNFLRCALQPFDDLKTALVAPAFHAYSLAADDVDLISTDPDEMLTPPSTPTFFQQSSSLDKLTPPKAHTLTQNFLLHLAKLQVSRYNFSNSSTYNLDGFTSPLSQHTLLIRTDILHTTAFQSFYITHPDPTTSITQWVQSAGLQTVFLNSKTPQVHLCIPPRKAKTTLFSHATTTLLTSQRRKARYSLNSLLHDRTTYKNYPWSTFAVHFFNLLDIPLLYDFLIFYTMIHGVHGGKRMVCQMIITLLVLRILERPSITLEAGRWKQNREFWGWFLPVLGWEYVVESLVGVWGLLTCWE